MKRTDEEKKAWKEKISAMMKKIRAMPKPAQRELAMTRGTKTPEGRELSPFNCCLLLAQSGGVYPMAVVGGFRQWQRSGRHVAKGQHACGVIFVPMGWKKSEDVDTETEDDAVRFILVPVFDLTQTEEGAGESQDRAAAG